MQATKPVYSDPIHQYRARFVPFGSPTCLQKQIIQVSLEKPPESTTGPTLPWEAPDQDNAMALWDTTLSSVLIP